MSPKIVMNLFAILSIFTSVSGFCGDSALGDFIVKQNFLVRDLGETPQLTYPVPDTMGAVGKSQYLVFENGRVRTFNKHHARPDGVLNVSADIFWGAALHGYACTDPHIEFDQYSDRWVGIGISRSTGPNSLLIAFSDRDPLDGATVWNFRSIDITTIQDVNSNTGDESSFADFPMLGISPDAIFITANMYDQYNGSFLGSNIYVIPKSSLFSSTNPPQITVFRHIGNVLNATPTIVPVTIYDPTVTVGYFISANAVSSNDLLLWTMNDPVGTPSLSGPVTIPVNQFSVNYNGGTDIFVSHKGNDELPNGLLDSFGDLLSAHLRDGSIWTAHTINVDSSGTSGPMASVSRNGVRWYEIAVTGISPTIRQQGTIYDQTQPNDQYQLNIWMPSIMTNSDGHMVVGFSVAGANAYINAGFTGRKKDDPLSTTRPFVLYTQSSTAYNPEADSTGALVRKWGEYSKVSVDPEDDTFWVAEEFCPAENLNGSQVIRIQKIL